jgi:hypothetical protein
LAVADKGSDWIVANIAALVKVYFEDIGAVDGKG